MSESSASEKLTARKRLNKALELIGIEAKKSLGQNFLVNDVVIDRIIKAAAELKPTNLVEIGPGPGALTELLLELKVPMTLIELDSQVANYWRSNSNGNISKVLEEDALKLDWRPLIGEGETVLVSNLPYQISSSLVIDRSLDQQPLRAMVLMFQKEVAQRIRAKESTDHYGMLSVVAQTFWKIETVTEAGPGDFSPPPKVASRVLRFYRNDNPQIQNRSEFLKLVKNAFQQRRKLLKANLSTYLGSRNIPQSELIQWLTEKKLKETARAEELSPQLFIEMSHRFGKG